MEIQYHGVLQLIVAICSSMKKMIILDFNVYNVEKNIVLVVDVIGIKIWLVNNIKYHQLYLKMIKNLWILLKDPSLNNVLNVNSGLKKIKAAIIWHANVSFSFVINVVEYSWNANVLKNKNKCFKPEEEIFKESDKEDNKWKSKNWKNKKKKDWKNKKNKNKNKNKNKVKNLNKRLLLPPEMLKNKAKNDRSIWKHWINIWL